MTLAVDRRPTPERVAEFMRGEVTRRTFRPPDPIGSVPVELWCRANWASVDVVGERAHFSALRAIVGAEHRNEGTEHFRPATLVPEPHNPQDHLAIAVHIDDHRIGYLASEDARGYHAAIAAILTSGRTPTVQARIWAADYSDRDDDGNSLGTRFGAGVRLTLDEPHLLLPVNSPPEADHVLVPHGGAIQVHGTTDHLDQLSRLPGDRGAAWAYATLNSTTEHLTRSRREIVEVRLDGDRVGKLTPKMSGDVLPAIRYLDRHGLVTTVRLLVTGNRAAVTATLYVARAHQLDDGWFDSIATGSSNRN